MSDPRAYIEGGYRCAVQKSDCTPDWWVGVSPRNGYGALCEGEWEDWVELARRILAADEQHRKAQSPPPTLEEALRAIAEQADVELALDPQWAKRMARAALAAHGTKEAGDDA